MSKTAELIDPKKFSRLAGELKQPVFDAGALARANAALEEMSGSFEQWMIEELDKLQAARAGCETNGWNIEAIDLLYAASHDLKGLGATYGYPLVTELAGSLSKLTETEAGKAAVAKEPALAAAHVDAIRAAVRDGIKTSSHPIGRALLTELTLRVAALDVAPR